MFDCAFECVPTDDVLAARTCALTLLADGVLDNSGTVSVGSQIELLNKSSVQNSGTITLAQGGDFKDQSGVTNTGTIDVKGGTLNIQVDVVDKVSKKTEQNRQELTPNGVVETKAMLNEKGGVDFTFSVVMRDPKGSYYRCMDVMTSAEGKNQLSYDFSTESGRKC